MAQDTSATKIKAGHKYGRVQRYETLSKQQKHVLKDLEKSARPGKFKMPETMRQGLDFLQRGITQGPQVSPMEQAGGGFLQNLLSRTPEQQYQTFAQPFMRQFREQTIPELAERFTAMGGQRSSAFQQALGAAGAGLSENLASLKGNLINQLLGQQIQGANVGLGYAQMPGQRFNQQMQAAQMGINSSLLPEEIQNRQRMAILNTQPWGSTMVAPQERDKGFWGTFGPQAAGALGGAAFGSMFGSPSDALKGALGGAQIGLGAMSGNPWLMASGFNSFGGGGGGTQRSYESPQMAGGF
jgi:hypothetical protein